VTVANLSDAERQSLRGVGGVKVTAVAAGAEQVGLRAGDVILGVGPVDVADLKQFDAAVAKLDRSRPLPVTVLRGGWALFLRIPPSKLRPARGKSGRTGLRLKRPVFPQYKIEVLVMRRIRSRRSPLRAVGECQRAQTSAGDGSIGCASSYNASL
jgi:hypothetical protein